MRTASMADEEVQYRLRPVERITDSVIPPAPGGLSRRMAIMIGLVLGISATVGVVGFFAWRNAQHERTEEAPPTPTPSAVTEIPSAAPSASTPPAASAAPVESVVKPPKRRRR